IIRRDEQLLQANIASTADGTELFKAGLYERAAVRLLNAADLNQGDALCRVRAGHALFALGRYDEAVKFIRRAFELQATLATLSYDLRDEYGRMRDFDQQFATLEQFVSSHPCDPSGLLMLGYVRYFTTGPGSAYTVLRCAKSLDPRNELIDKLLA